MKILALNPGSGTLQYKVLETSGDAGPEDGTLLKDGKVDHVHGDATVEAAELAVAKCLPLGLDAIGHRVVHGGSRFDGPARITPEVLEVIESLSDLAPLHNPIDLATIKAVSKRAPGVTGVAVFDNAFHRTLPEVAWRYALPLDVSEGEVRRFGFHGIAHRNVAERLPEYLMEGTGRSRFVLCHIGGGASLCAVKDGKSVDTSMGMTPLEGLVMGTRSGNLDPGLVLYLLRHKGFTIESLEDLLYHRSGLLGLSGRSDDLRDLEPAAQAGDRRSELALAVHAHHIRKSIGAFAAVLGGMDALALSGALAENSASMRSRALEGLEFLGLRLDSERNFAARPDQPCRISAEDSPVPIWLVPVDEERQIAREVAALLEGPG